jgi:endonuclease-3 related protein
MLLYAGGRLRFVVDAYTRRIFSRHGWCVPEADYDSLQRLCETALGHRPARERLDYWQDYHAQLVMVGKNFCRPREPRCDVCPLRWTLPRLGSASGANAMAEASPAEDNR